MPTAAVRRLGATLLLDAAREPIILRFPSPTGDVMKRILMIAGAVIGALAMQAAPATARDYYGAIAYSNSTGALGWSYDYGSRGEAEDAALSECHGGCSAVLWFRNAYGAIATASDHSYGAGWATSRGRAE